MVQCTNGGLKIRLKKLMVQNVHYLNGLPSQVTLPFEYRTPILSSIQMNLVFGIQMVTVFINVQACRIQISPVRVRTYHDYEDNKITSIWLTLSVENRHSDTW